MGKVDLIASRNIIKQICSSAMRRSSHQNQNQNQNGCTGGTTGRHHCVIEVSLCAQELAEYRYSRILLRTVRTRTYGPLYLVHSY